MRNLSYLVCVSLLSCVYSADVGESDPNAMTQPGAETGALVSGARLKVRVLVGADGSRVKFGFYDTLKNMNCEFVGIPEKGAYCLPQNYAEVFSTVYGVYYFDAACSKPAVRSKDVRTVSSLTLLDRIDRPLSASPVETFYFINGFVKDVWRASIVRGTSVLYTYSNSSSCVVAPADAIADSFLYSVEPVSFDEFVKANIELE